MYRGQLYDVMCITKFFYKLSGHTHLLWQLNWTQVCQLYWKTKSFFLEEPEVEIEFLILKSKLDQISLHPIWYQSYKTFFPCH